MLSCNMKSAIIILVVTLHLCMVTSSSSESRARHKRAWIIDSFTIEEENPGPFPYRLGKVHVDRDYRVKFKLLGGGVDEDPVGVLQIDENTGYISVLGKVDFEEHRVLKLKFEARNVSNEKLDTRLGVEISILDINDQAPTFQKQVYEVTIDESQQQGTSVLTVRATDFDKPGTLNATVEYKILSVTPITSDAEFFIEETGRISFKGCLDYEKANKYTIVVEAKDRGEKVQLSSSSTVIVNVLDKNNYLPVFNGVTGLGRVKERESGMTPLRIHVTDKDTKGTAAWRVRYTIKGDYQGNFEIHTDPETNDGILTVVKLKFEARNVSNEKLDTRLGVEISILDINDQAPTFQKQVYEVTIDESQQQGTSVLTVRATDFDKPGTLNATVEYKILSVTPITSDAEFFIEETGRISFKGCLDYEKANKYTIVVEAKDRGEKVQLSSSSTVIVNVLDKNNYLPVFNGVTGLGRVKERESGMTPLRIHVTDKDTKGTAAWRVRYTIKGDYQGNFEIHTDPETNDGILTVVKPLDYELASVKQLSITAENEDPYFSCELKRKTSGTLWKVININADPGKGGVPVFVSSNVTIFVEDINDPPEFTFSAREVVVDEDVSVGHYLETFTASDPDGKSPNDFEYIKGDDPGNWVSVDPKTGAITTVNALDRESPYVVNGTYLITLYAVDKGEPPMTATATLTLHVTDKNDNLPQLQSNTISMCLSDDATMTNISAYDLDDAPYSGPFRFELVGEDKSKWSLDTNYGTTVNLIKKSTVYAGFYKLQLKVYDQQERFSVQNITVAACDCSIRQDCFARADASKTQINSSAIGIVFAALLLLLGILLLGLRLTCGREKTVFPFSIDSGDVLLSSNIETPGTDCKIPETHQLVKQDQSKTATQAAQGLHGQNGTLIQSSNEQAIDNQRVGAIRYKYRNHINAVYKTMSLQWSLSRNERYKDPRLLLLMQADNLPMENRLGQDFKSPRNNYLPVNGGFTKEDEVLWSLLGQVVQTSLTDCQELSDYNPRVYAYEGDLSPDAELESICTDEEEANFSPQDLLELDRKFIKLAEILIPHPALR